MNIQHNMKALNARRNIGVANTKNVKAQEKLSSGYRINRAGDDAAGLAISEKMRAQVRGLTQASRNTQDAISMLQTAEGAYGAVNDMLRRIKTLAIQSATDTNTSEDRTSIQLEVNQLINEIDRIGQTTEFNGKKIIDPSNTTTYEYGTILTFHIGANEDQITKITLLPCSSGFFLGEWDDGISEFVIPGGILDISTVSLANAALPIIDKGIGYRTMLEGRSRIGEFINRLEYTQQNLDISAENLQSAESRIRDVDMAAEVLEQTQTNVLQQAAQSMLTLANQQPQNVLQLFD